MHYGLIFCAAAGINKFYLTDTGSKPPMQAVLQDYIDAGLVEYTFDTKVGGRRRALPDGGLGVRLLPYKAYGKHKRLTISALARRLEIAVHRQFSCGSPAFMHGCVQLDPDCWQRPAGLPVMRLISLISG